MLGTATARVRPLRLALLVDPGNASQVREAIRIASSVWGGAFFPIVPVFKRLPSTWKDPQLKSPKPADVVRGYIEAFDPDLLVQLCEELPDYISKVKLEVVKPSQLWDNSGDSGQRPLLPIYGINAADLLVDVFKDHFKFVSKFPVTVNLPVIPTSFGLFWASVFGEYPANFAELIKREFGVALALTEPRASADTYFAMTEPDMLFPRRITEWKLDTRGRRQSTERATVFYMDASKVEDVVDYWNLRATGRHVLPMPRQFLSASSFEKAYAEFTGGGRHSAPGSPGFHDRVFVVPSRNTKLDEMESFVRSTTVPSPAADENGGSKATSGVVLQHWYPRLWDEWTRSRDGEILRVYGTDESTIDIDDSAEPKFRIKPVLPDFVPDSLFRSVTVCVNEYDFRLYGADRFFAEVFPKIEGESLRHAVSGISFREWRVGRHGLVKLVGHDFAETRTIPESDLVMFAWLRDRGWEAKLSAPGILAKQIFKQLGGFTQMLADKNVLNTIEHMNGGVIERTGVLKNQRVSGQREMAVAHIKTSINGKNTNIVRFERLVERGVFKIGYTVQCPTCTRDSWYAMTSLSETLNCPLCLQPFPAAGNVDRTKGGWSYRTSGPFSVPNFADGAFSVLLAMDAISGRMSGSRLTTAVPSFEAKAPDGAHLEADFAMFWRESGFDDELEGVLFGECKSFGPFKAKDVTRMETLGRTFPGSILVFSTLRASLTPDEIAAISKIAKRSRKQRLQGKPSNSVLVLTEAELLTHERPPYCWGSPLKETFRSVRTLLDWCYASQQIHLGLPSLHDEIRKHFDMSNAPPSSDVEAPN